MRAVAIMWVLGMLMVSGPAMAVESAEGFIRQMVEEFDDIDHEHFLKFLRSHREVVAHIDRLRKHDREEAEMFLGDVVNVYFEYNDLREHDPDAAEQLLRFHKGELAANAAGQRIREMREAAARDGKLDSVAGKLEAEKKALREQINALFGMKQKVYERQIKEMEMELAELKAMMGKREKNRERIIDNHFLELIGEGDTIHW